MMIQNMCVANFYFLFTTTEVGGGGGRGVIHGIKTKIRNAWAYFRGFKV